MPLPHIKNSYAGVNNLDPVHNCMFGVFFTLPEALRAEFQKDEMLLSEHVTKISGLGTLDAKPEPITQKFMGTTRTYLSPKLGSTSHELTVDFTLNLRNHTDNYIYKLFKAWNNLGYNLGTGELHEKEGYIAEWLKVEIANRPGDVYRKIVYKNVMMVIETPVDELDQDNNEACTLTVKFISDWAEEINA